MSEIKWEEFEQNMHDNVENMVGEFELDKIYAVSTTKSHSYSKADKSDMMFEGITIYPAGLYDDVIQHIESIIDKDDCDTVSNIIDLFTYTITPNMLLTRTNAQIMNEAKVMLEAYDVSIIRFAYDSKGVFKQSLKYDYDKDEYVLQHDLYPIVSNDEFQCANNVRYEYTSKGGTVNCRWYPVQEENGVK